MIAAEAVIIFGFAMLVFAGLYASWVLININIAHGQDIDPCFVNNDMFQRICDQQEIEKIYQQLLERAQEWNEIHK